MKSTETNRRRRVPADVGHVDNTADDAAAPQDDGGDRGDDRHDAAKSSGTAAFSKFMTVLQAVSDASMPPTASQLAASCGYPRPTVYRIIGALAAQGLVVEQAAGTFIPGARLIHFARRSLERLDVRAAAVEALRTLRDITGETIHLAVRGGQQMVYVDKLESLHAVRMASQIGSSVTLYSSSVGKAFIAALPVEERRQALLGVELKRFTEHTITDRAMLDIELEMTRQRGYAEDREENEADIFCYGCAILDRDRRPVGAVSISVPRFRQPSSPHDRYIAPLVAACREIGAKMNS